MLDHVVTVVLKQPKDGQLAKALDQGGIQEIMDVLTLSQPARDVLAYQEDDDSVKALSIGHKGMLRVLKIFANFCQTSSASIDDWTAVTKKNFDDFRCSEVCMIATKKSDALSSLASAFAPVAKQKDVLSDFKKGIKRDASLFMVLKDPKEWDSWHCSTVAQVRA